MLLGLITKNTMAQNSFSVVLEVQVETATPTGDDIYITGNFNQWNPKDTQYILQKSKQKEDVYHIELKHIPAGILEYKFTRGTWQTLECSTKGRLLNLHDRIIDGDMKITETIRAWRDQYPASTAPEHLIVLENFVLPELNRTRTIRIYLPKDYAESKQQYPVWYMHDGQDLFDEAISEGRLGPVEWGIDETIQALGDHYIIVGIDHDYEKNRRENEYSFLPTQKTPIAEGKKYLEFIVNTLKPYVDAKYRTLNKPEYTGIAGGSLGGLISLYAGLTYPEIFGKVGVFSPSIWQDDQNLSTYIATLTATHINQLKQQRYFFYAGGRENRKIGSGNVVRMDEDVLTFLKQVDTTLPLDYQIKIDPMGKHGAWYWQQAFAWMITLDSNNLKSK